MLKTITRVALTIKGFLRSYARIFSVLFSVLLALYLWILFALNTTTPDYDAYQHMYLNSSSPIYSKMEIGYMLLNTICLKLGLSYTGFRAVLATIIIVLTVITIRQYTQKVSFTLIAFLIFPYLAFVSGVRNTLAASVICFSIQYLLQNKKGSNIKYIIGIIIAVSIHYSALFYLIFLIARKRINYLLIYILFIFILPGLIFLILYTNIPFTLVSFLTSSEKVLQWFDLSSFENTNLTGLATSTGLIMINYLLVKWAFAIHSKNHQTDNSDLAGNSVILNDRTKLIINNINVLMFMLVPFLAIELTYLRILYNILLLSYAIIASVIFNDFSNRKSINIRLLKYSTLSWSFILALYYCYGVGNLLLPVLKNNLLFDFLP